MDKVEEKLTSLRVFPVEEEAELNPSDGEGEDSEEKIGDEERDDLVGYEEVRVRRRERNSNEQANQRVNKNSDLSKLLQGENSQSKNSKDQRQQLSNDYSKVQKFQRKGSENSPFPEKSSDSKMRAIKKMGSNQSSLSQSKPLINPEIQPLKLSQQEENVMSSQQTLSKLNLTQEPSSMTKLLQLLQNLMTAPDDSCAVFAKDFWPKIFDTFNHHRMNKYELEEFFDNMEMLAQFNFQGYYKISDKELTVENFGQKFHKLDNILHFKEQRAKKYAKFISSRNFNMNLKNEFTFMNLNFDMSQDEVLKLAAKVRTFFQEDMGAFAFLSLYLINSILKKLEQQKTWKQVQMQYKIVLELLQREYPANGSQMEDIDELQEQYKLEMTLKRYKSLPEREKFELVEFEVGQSAYGILEKHIVEKSEEAKNKKEVFDKLAKYICYEKGYGFKSGVKVKSPQCKDSILRTIQKLIEQQIKEHNQKKQAQQQEKDSNYPLPEVKLKLKMEQQNAIGKIKYLLDKKSSIVFKAKDLLRGKSTFEKVQDLLQAKRNIEKRVLESNGKYLIIEEKNKLYGKTKDLVLIIKIEKVIAELQLVLKMDSHSNEFNHKIYELKRSEVYSMIPNLFVQNRKWCNRFFGDQLGLINFLMSCQKEKIRKIQEKQEDSEIDQCGIEEFEQMLKKQGLLSEFGSEQIDKESHWIKKIRLTCEVIKQNLSIEKKTLNSQKINEVRFLKEFNDLEKAHQILKCILNQIKTDEEKQRSEIFFEEGSINELIWKYDEALKKYLECLKIRTKIFGTVSIPVSIVLDKIGVVYKNQGNYAKALENELKSLEIKKQIFEPESIEIATTLNNIGSVYKNQGYYEEALEYYNKCLKIRTKVLEHESSDVAATLNNIGIVYHLEGDCKKALENLSKALEIRTKIFGPDSKDVAQTLNNMGAVYDEVGMYKTALEHYTKSLEIRKRIFGSESKDVGETLSNIASVYDNQENFEKSLEYYERCLQIERGIFGHESKDVATTLSNMGSVYSNKEEYEMALEYYNECLKIRKKIFGNRSKEVRMTEDNIGVVHEHMKGTGRFVYAYKKSK